MAIIIILGVCVLWLHIFCRAAAQNGQNNKLTANDREFARKNGNLTYFDYSSGFYRSTLTNQKAHQFTSYDINGYPYHYVATDNNKIIERKYCDPQKANQIVQVGNCNPKDWKKF